MLIEKEAFLRDGEIMMMMIKHFNDELTANYFTCYSRTVTIGIQFIHALVYFKLCIHYIIHFSSPFMLCQKTNVSLSYGTIRNKFIRALVRIGVLLKNNTLGGELIMKDERFEPGTSK